MSDVQKNHLVGQMLYRSLDPSKKTAYFRYFFSPEDFFNYCSQYIFNWTLSILFFIDISWR